MGGDHPLSVYALLASSVVEENLNRLQTYEELATEIIGALEISDSTEDIIAARTIKMAMIVYDSLRTHARLSIRENRGDAIMANSIEGLAPELNTMIRQSAQSVVLDAPSLCSSRKFNPSRIWTLALINSVVIPTYNRRWMRIVSRVAWWEKVCIKYGNKNPCLPSF